MSNASVEINSIVNELYIKTKVTQKLKNETENPLELKIYINKIKENIFRSFSAQIGDSILVKSKVIKKKKAEEKYTDSIASGNAAIFVSNDPDNSERIIINMGNIPPKQELLFISEFIQFTDSSELYEFELFRNLPLFKGKVSFLQISEVKGTIEISTRNKINKIEKKTLSDKLNIIEEKFANEKKCNYIIKYEYKNLTKIYSYNANIYIPSSKICFETENETKTPFSNYQKSPKENTTNYIIQYKNYSKGEEEIVDDVLNPSIFIFLIDQSGSMSGHSMEVAKKALILFLQSLPADSYYQIIGFGSDYEKYDMTPKEYTQNNIKQSIKFIETIRADKGGTNIYAPLRDIYSSIKEYNKIKLPKNIFLLTDGSIENKADTLNIIEQNNNEFFIYSIGIGNYFDKDLIKNAGVLGKGNYDFCNDIAELNEVIVKELRNASKPFYCDFVFSSNLDSKNLYTLNEPIVTIKENQIVNIKYILDKEEEKINLNIKYKKYSKKGQKIEEFQESYEINSSEIEAGEELSQLIINEYLLNNKELSEEEKTKIALKYQILTDYTSLFAEVDLSEKINEEMKKEIIGDEKKNVLSKTHYEDDDEDYDKDFDEDYDDIYDNHLVGSALKSSDLILEPISEKLSAINNDLISLNNELKCQGACMNMVRACPPDFEESNFKTAKPKSSGFSNFFKSIGNSIKGLFSKKTSNEDSKNNAIEDEKGNVKEDEKIENKINKVDNKEIEEKIKNESKNEGKNEIKNDIKEKKNEIIIDGNKDKKSNKELNIKDIINEQNFVEGFWELNETTGKVKEKYEKEFKLLKELKDKNFNDNVTITILIIYLINKEHPELLNELYMIIQKAKKFIQKITNDSYENIIKVIGI